MTRGQDIERGRGKKRKGEDRDNITLEISNSGWKDRKDR